MFPKFLKVELIVPLGFAKTKKQQKFATSSPSLAPVVTLPHWDFPMSRVGQEERVGGFGVYMYVCGREQEGETVITNSSPGSPRSVD